MLFARVEVTAAFVGLGATALPAARKQSLGVTRYACMCSCHLCRMAHFFAESLEVRERRARTSYAVPRLTVTAPNQVRRRYIADMRGTAISADKRYVFVDLHGRCFLS